MQIIAILFFIMSNDDALVCGCLISKAKLLPNHARTKPYLTMPTTFLWRNQVT